jgi:polysaccharide biosynthesis protein PslH
MRVLFLTQIIPYPPDAGPRIKTWHCLRYIVEHGHEVILASFVRPEEKEYVATLQQVCEAVYTVPIRRSRKADILYWLRSQITGRPFLVERDDLAEMEELVKRLLATETVDIVHADQLTMTQFAPIVQQHGLKIYDPSYSSQVQEDSSALKLRNFSRHPALIFDAHNAVWTIMERMRQNVPVFLKPFLALEARRIKKFEGRITRLFDHTLAVTEVDRLALQEAASSVFKDIDVNSLPVKVIPIAVDTYQLQPAKRLPGSHNIMTLGTMRYPPNADGIRWFIHEVFPLVRQQIPDVTLTVVGKDPPRDLLRMASQTITFTGYVPDLTPFFEQAALMVVPVRAGGGMRVRILEGFARAMPIVTTTIGLEGIEACPDEDVLVQDTTDGFAEAVVRLISDEVLQARLGVNGRCLAMRKYDWKAALGELGAVYSSIEIERNNKINS